MCTPLTVDTLQLSRLSNARIFLHPYTLSVFVVGLSMLMYWSGVLKAYDSGRLILFSSSLVAVILITGEWTTRTHFENKATALIKSDLADLHKHYGKDRFLVATLGGDRVIGTVGLEVKGRVGILKHWHIQGQYRNRGLGWDMVEMVISNARHVKKNPIHSVQGETYNLQTRAEKSLKQHGFQRTQEDVPEGRLGLFGIVRRTWSKRL